jgi:PIN domain nuclease of toxin-antitoxin system
VKLLLDTHMAIWAALDRAKPTDAESRLMSARESRLVLSAVAIWEIRLKWNSFHISGERKGPLDAGSIRAFATAMQWEMLALTPRHAAAQLAHPLGHRDPFDELLMVQAQEEEMRLPTRDSKLLGHPLAASGI